MATTTDIASSTPVLYPNNTLPYSHLNIDPQTISLAKSLCAPFSFSSTVQARLRNAFIIPLRPDSEHDKIQHDINTIASSLEGLSFLAILGVLMSYYNDPSVASVFNVLAEEAKVPDDLMPGMKIWEEMASCFVGQLDVSEFAGLEGRYTRLRPERNENTDEVRRKELQHASAGGVIEFLNCMRRLSRGEDQHHSCIMMLAGLDAGWTAAVAEWLFEIKLDICAQGGKVLESNYKDGERALSIRFQEPGIPCDGVPIVSVPLVHRKVI